MVTLLALSMIAPFRPPAVPLVTHNPFFSVWSCADKLTDGWATHWSGEINGMCGLVRIDDHVYRWMGPASVVSSQNPIPPLEQTSVKVTATRSVYTFTGGGIELEAEFCSPMLADDLDLVGRPVTYLTLTAKATDGKGHRVSSYVDWTGEWVVAQNGEDVVAARHRLAGREALSIRKADQRPLAFTGDRTRVDWGTLYVTGPGQSWIGGHSDLRSSFVKGAMPDGGDVNFPRAASDNWPVIALGANLDHPATFTIGYDEGYAVEWLRRKLRPYWNRNEIGFSRMISTAVREADTVRQRAAEFDAKTWQALEKVGGPEYAQLASLAYRQCLAGHGLVEDVDGNALMFSKENTSNGCIATVDVTFPASPFFLYFNPQLLKAQLRPVLEYASMARWPFPFAPHDLGQYPLANGQVYGGGERDESNQMPVEESANMLLMIAGLCRQDKNADFARPYWKQLTAWAHYLEEEGFDPGEQLCTDDFTGHLAHNTNLSIKAIVALRAYGELCGLMGDKAQSDHYTMLTQGWAVDWVKKADDGDHYRLAFDRPNTWSQKYNLYWDKLLGYKLFSDATIRKELDWYKKVSNVNGFPLDNRATFTKGDWLFWSASLAPTQAEFEALAHPVFIWLNTTSSRVPFADWYDTKSGNEMGMHARTVIGGVFARALVEKGL